jgi:hypothetical protein
MKIFVKYRGKRYVNLISIDYGKRLFVVDDKYRLKEIPAGNKEYYAEIEY